MPGQQIKTWGCAKKSEKRSFHTNKRGRPIVRIQQEIECRYDLVGAVNEEIAEEEADMPSSRNECGDKLEDLQLEDNNIPDTSMKTLMENWKRFRSNCQISESKF